MKMIQRSILSLLMAFAFLGLAACDNGGANDEVGGGGVGMEEPLNNGVGMEEPLNNDEAVD